MCLWTLCLYEYSNLVIRQRVIVCDKFVFYHDNRSTVFALVNQFAVYVTGYLFVTLSVNVYTINFQVTVII